MTDDRWVVERLCREATQLVLVERLCRETSASRSDVTSPEGISEGRGGALQSPAAVLTIDQWRPRPVSRQVGSEREPLAFRV